jgi:phosphoglycolate phosphatase
VRRLILFDIDGTLVDVRGAGRRAFGSALAEAYGVVDDLADVRFAGATDKGVLAQLRGRHVLPEQDEPRFFRAMETHLAAALTAEPPLRCRGVDTALARVFAAVDADAGADVCLGFVTGNAMRCAFVKVEAAGIDRARFDVGGYGDEHADRDVLAKLALARAEKARGRFDRVIVVGDTPSDIKAARAISAVAVAVTTGHVDKGALGHADVVVDALADVDLLAL